MATTAKGRRPWERASRDSVAGRLRRFEFYRQLGGFMGNRHLIGFPPDFMGAGAVTPDRLRPAYGTTLPVLFAPGELEDDNGIGL